MKSKYVSNFKANSFKLFAQIILLIIVQSCQKETIPIVVDNTTKLKESTTIWLNSKKDTTSNIKSATIDTIVAKLIWKQMQISEINDSSGLAYIPFENELNKGVTILFNKNDFSIDTANIISVKLLNNNNVDINNFNIYTKSFDANFSGILSVFSIDNQFKSSNGILKGEKIFSGEVRKTIRGQRDAIKASSLKINSSLCSDYYFVTTYSDGTEIWSYLYTSCTSDCEITSTIQLAITPKIKSNCLSTGSGGGADLSDAQYDAELQLFETNYRTFMSDEEKNIFDNEMNISQRIKYLINAKSALTLAGVYFEGSLSNGKGDAFRHAFFIALNARTLNPDLASRLANAHENKDLNNSLSKEMDLRNNKIGLDLFYALNTIPNDYISYFTILQVELMSKINNGGLGIINNLDLYFEPTVNSKLIKSNE